MAAKPNPSPPSAKPANISALPFDSHAPASVESEMALVGAALGNPDVYIEASSIVTPGDFYLLKHQHVWEAIGELVQQGEPVDVLTISQRLETKQQLGELGGASGLVQLMNSTPTSVHASFYAQLVMRASVRRGLMRAADEQKALARDEQLDLETVIARSEAASAPYRARALSSLGTTMRDGVQIALDVVDRAGQRLPQDELIYIGRDIGLDDLMGGGWMRGKISVPFARSEHGKTAFMMNAALEAARPRIRQGELHQGATVAFFSTEIPKDEVFVDLLAMEAGLHSLRLRNGGLNEREYEQVLAASGRLAEMRIVVYEAQSITPEGIYNLSRDVKQASGLDMVCVDYIQRVAIPDDKKFKGNTYIELEYVMNALEKMCRPTKLNVHMMVNAQVNRVVDQQKDKHPHKSQIEGNNKIEQYADICIGLYRHGAAEPDSPTPTYFDMDVQKNRVTSRYGRVTRRLNPSSRKLERLGE